jgi:hypothetical protein
MQNLNDCCELIAIVKSLDCVDEIAQFQPVPADQLFKKSKSAPKPETE